MDCFMVLFKKIIYKNVQWKYNSIWVWNYLKTDWLGWNISLLVNLNIFFFLHFTPFYLFWCCSSENVFVVLQWLTRISELVGNCLSLPSPSGKSELLLSKSESHPFCVSIPASNLMWQWAPTGLLIRSTLKVLWVHIYISGSCCLREFCQERLADVEAHSFGWSFDSHISPMTS